MKKTYFLLIFILLIFKGCVVGTVASLPFKVVGAVTPTIVGDGISATGDAVDMAIPF